MKKKRKNSFYYYLAVLLIIIFCLTPIIWCFIISISPNKSLLKNDYSLFPKNMILDNYNLIFNSKTNEHQTIMLGLKNSIKISVLTLIISTPLTVISGYIFTFYNFKGKNIFINLLLLTIVIPVFTTLIPIYNIFRNLNFLDNMFWTSIIYISSIIPFNIWIMINHYKQIPIEILQAASLDGFSRKQTFFKVILPLSTPAIITTCLITFLMSWKQYIIPTILLSSYQNRTITMVLSDFMTRDMIQYGIISACGIISIIPPILIAIIFRKYLVANITSGSIK